MQDLDKIPVYVITSETDMQNVTDDFAYLIAKGGLYIKRKCEMFDSISKTDRIPHLANIEESCRLAEEIDKVPGYIIETALSFFRAVFEKFDSEAVLYITKGTEWGLHCPEQEVSRAGVESLTKLEELTTEQVIGSIHSHADFDAFHSNTDIGDEAKFDGVHFTIGHVDLIRPTLVCSIAAGGVRARVTMQEIIEGKIMALPKEFPPEWMERVHKKKWLYGKKFKNIKDFLDEDWREWE